jgi:RNA polymerase sigma-70 factor (ECF subfamily)
VQDERSLVQRAQQLDQEAFAQLYERHFDRIYRYVALKIGSKVEAEDMTQQVFLKALRSISSYKWRDTPFSAWLYRIAHNQVVDYLRKKARQTEMPLNESLVGSESDHEKTTEQKLDMEKLMLATRQLTPAQQEVIALRFTSELSIAEVAKVMGKSEGAVKALQHSAILALRKILVVD